MQQSGEFSLGRRLWHMAPLLLPLASLMWAGNFIVGRFAGLEASGLDPVSLAFFRWIAASVLIVLIGGRFAWRDRQAIRRHLPILALFGLLSVTSYNTLIYLGLQTTTALNGLLLQSVLPLMAMAFGLLLYRNPVTGRQGIGILLSLLGVAWILTRGNPTHLLEAGFGIGDLYVLAAVISYAIYSAMLRQRPAIHPLSFLVVAFLTGTAFLFPIWLFTGGPATLPSRPEDWLMIAYLAVFASILAALFFNQGVALIGANRATAYLHLMPVFGSLLAVALLGERLQLYHIGGALGVIAGLVVASGRPLLPRFGKDRGRP